MDTVSFKIDGNDYNISGNEVSSDTTLYEYLRYTAGKVGTKSMCQEGGCGVCLVSVKRTLPNGEKSTIAVNSCLVYVLSCNQWEITTVEGLGNWLEGYSDVQRKLAAANGTQCGYCTPGWVINMHCLLESSGGKISSKEVENSFGGNLCRCTGYRPILDAFKSFAQDADPSLKNQLQDMEDLGKAKCNKKCERRCSIIDSTWCLVDEGKYSNTFTIKAKRGTFFKAETLADVMNILQRNYQSYRLINGNTGRGVYPISSIPQLVIDISSVHEIQSSMSDVNLVLGSGMTLTEVMNTFKEKSASNENFMYLNVLYKHIDLVAHVPVRNVGTIGGNLALKNQYKSFPSDLFLIFETVGATVSTVDVSLSATDHTLPEFLHLNMNKKLVTNVKLPPLCSSYLLRTYKIMPRAQNAHAIMNAGFLFKLDAAKKVQQCSIVYGAVSADFIHASQTEKALKGLSLFTNSTLQKALTKLNSEVQPEDVLGESNSYTKKMVALGLFYKAMLDLAPADQVDDRYKSGGEIFERPVSRATQYFDTDRSLWPLNQPITKIEALKQCSGEAKYSDDIVPSVKQVHVALILSTIHKGELDTIDKEAAKKLPGVITVLTAKDIPGTNTFTPTKVTWQTHDEEILASKQITHYGQVIGLVVAKTRSEALQAAKLVPVKYTNVGKDKPVLTIEDVLAASDKNDRMQLDYNLDPKETPVKSTKTVKGVFNCPTQYHFHMETQTTCAKVDEFGLHLNVSTQFVDLVQVAVAAMLGIKESDVNIKVSRVGGGYGGKASRSSQFACACALVAHTLNVTSRLVLPLQDNMSAVGMRQRCRADYEVSFDDDGVIQSLDCTYYEDCGVSYNDTSTAGTGMVLTELYNTARWKLRGYSMRTDKPANTWCRGPSTTEAFAITEHIMTRIAFVLNKTTTDVQIANLAKKHIDIKDIIVSFKKECEYDQRKADVQQFNASNAWRKRSIKTSIMAFPLMYDGTFSVTISVHHGDGSVSISHAGIEMGQGIHTKAAQVCAYSLKIPMDKISMKPTYSFVSPNSLPTNGSYTSESIAYAIVKACEELMARLQPIIDSLTKPTWEQIVAEAYKQKVNLQVTHLFTGKEVEPYTIYGVTVAELELDVLTGVHWLRRVDLLEDTGRSISPLIDVGQIEGAFMMGVGLWTSEDIVHDPKTGRNVTDRTWTYKPPGAKDIPIDYRIYFRRNATNNTGILRSKATGEPAIVMAVVVYHCVQDTVAEARKEFGYRDNDWVHIGAPCNAQNIMEAMSPKIEYFKLKNM